jgi:hypothetical protein
MIVGCLAENWNEWVSESENLAHVGTCLKCLELVILTFKNVYFMDFFVISVILNAQGRVRLAVLGPESNREPLPYGRQARQTLCYATPHLNCSTQLVLFHMLHVFTYSYDEL